MLNFDICSPILGIKPQTNSGGEVYDRELLLHLAMKGINHLIFMPSNLPYIKHPNFYVCRAPIKTMFPPYIFNLFVLNFLNKSISKFSYPTIRLHDPYFTGPAGVLFKLRCPKIKLITNYHHLETSFLKKTIDKQIIHYWDAITVDSLATKKDFLTSFPEISDQKVHVIYAGLADYYKPKSNSNIYKTFANLKKWEFKKKLLFLGGLKPRKNLLFLIPILKKLPDEFVLVIAGTGIQRKSAEKLVLNLGLSERVLFTGFVNEEIKPEIFSWADATLLPSKMEGFGMIAAESQACGTPVIASNCGSLPEVIDHNRSGYVIPLDEKIWVKTILSLFKTQGLINDFSISGKQFVKKFSWHKSADQFINIHESLI